MSAAASVATAPRPLLEVQGVKTYYGKIIALKASTSRSTRARSSR